MVRDNELSRLIKYAQGMGIKVHFKTKKRGTPHAEWVIDGSEISIYVTNRCTKINKILSLIHELSHHKSFVNNNRIFDPKVEEALNSNEERKIYRKRILDMEIRDSSYWEDIYKDTNCAFGLDKLNIQRDFDIWMYEVYYETGKYPKIKQKNDKLKEIKNFYRKRYD